MRGGGEEIWADGLNEDAGLLRDAKSVADPKESPYVAGSDIDPAFRSKVEGSQDGEFSRYKAVIEDPASPVIGLEIVTNEPLAVPFFEGLLNKFAVPGRVIVRK